MRSTIAFTLTRRDLARQMPLNRYRIGGVPYVTLLLIAIMLLPLVMQVLYLRAADLRHSYTLWPLLFAGPATVLHIFTHPSFYEWIAPNAAVGHCEVEFADSELTVTMTTVWPPIPPTKVSIPYDRMAANGDIREVGDSIQIGYPLRNNRIPIRAVFIPNRVFADETEQAEVIAFVRNRMHAIAEA